MFAVLTVLLLILVGGVFVKLLSKVADGSIELSFLLPMLLWGAVKTLPLLIVVSVFLGILLTLGRFYKDNEIYAMQASGMSNRQLLTPFIGLSLFISLFLLASAAWLGPHAEHEVRALRAQAGQKIDLGGIAPGQFVSLPGGRVVFAETLNQESRQLEKVFLFEETASGVRSISAETARQIESDEFKAKYLELNDGRIFEGGLAGAKVSSGVFAAMGFKLPEFDVSGVRERVSMLPMSALIGSEDPKRLAEFHWRLSHPVSLLVLTLLALPLSKTGPRQGRFANIAIAILLYIFYTNLLGLGKSLLEKSDLPMWAGLWWVHILFVVLALVLWLQQSGKFQRRKRLGTAS